jgi:1-acyl-sn-glycerol-3-phosphate acyltransferase
MDKILHYPQFQRMLTAIQWLGYFAVNLIFVITIPYLKRTFLGRKWSELTSDWNMFGKFGLRVFGIHSQFYNPHKVDLSQQHLIVCNHRSWFDQIAIMEQYPRSTHFLAKAAYFDLPFFKYCLNSCEVIPVHNGHLKKEVGDRLSECIDKGDDVVFFAEGTRGTGRKLLPFRKGAFKQAARTGLPILPMYILGSEQCMSKQTGSILDVKPGEIVIIVGRPAYFTEENLEEEMQAFERRYTSVHNKLYDEYELYCEMFHDHEAFSSPMELNYVF